MKNVQTIIIGVLWTFLLSTLFPAILFAHGEDEQAGTEAIAPAGQMNVKVAQSDGVEILVKYPTPKPAEEITLFVFLTDLKTNAPIEKADLTLVISYSDPNQLSRGSSSNTHAAVHPAAGKALPTDTPGIYQAKVVLPEPGQYNLGLKLTGENLAGAVNITAIEVPGPEAQAEGAGVRGGRLPLGIAALLLYILAGGMSYLFWIRPRRTGPVTESRPVYVGAEEHKG